MTTMLMEPLAPWVRDLNRFASGGGRAPFTPPADILVTDQDVKVEMDVPGVSTENLEIELENDILTIRGERPFPYGDRDSDQASGRVERSFGSFERVLRVPRGLDPNAIEAELHDGVLTLRIPRPEPPKPHRIQIRHEASGDGGAGGQQRGAERREESRQGQGNEREVDQRGAGPSADREGASK
jgi:HSP20 family protein